VGEGATDCLVIEPEVTLNLNVGLRRRRLGRRSTEVDPQGRRAR
jgi:hypothetical protein